MPYPNFHSCRLADPDRFGEIRRENGAATVDGKSVDHLYGIDGESSELQAIRYPADEWTAEQARSHCTGHDNLEFEAATGRNNTMSTTTNSKQLRRETEDGTDWIVAPVVAQREGVYTYPDGDGGARHEFVPGEELSANADAWNDTPLVLEHPEGPDGRPVSVNHPNADTTEIGEFRNAHPNSDGDALAGEVWFRENEVGTHGGSLQRYIDDLEAQGAGEVSTGYMAGQIETAEGTYDGRRYNFVQRNLQPDHLAVLPGEQTGDCAVADGCGIGVVANHADDTAFRANRALDDGEADVPSQDGGAYAQLGRRVADAIGLGDILAGGRVNAGGESVSDDGAESSGGESAPPSADEDTTKETPMSLDDEEKIDRLVENHAFTREHLEGLGGTECLTRIHEEFAEGDPDGGGDGGSDGGDGDGGDGGDGDGTPSSSADGGSSGADDDDPDEDPNMSEEDLTPDAIREIVQAELDAQTDQVVDAVEQARANERHVELVANSDEYPLDAEDLADMDAAAVEKLADEVDADMTTDTDPRRANYAGTPTGASFDASEASNTTDVPAAGYDTYRENTEGDD